MSWKLEIYRAIFVAFGMCEIISNTSFLCLKNGLKNARKQHQEIPGNVSEKQLKIKVTFMLVFGVFFFALGMSSYFLHSVNHFSYLMILTLFAVYAIGETIYYKYWKTCGFSIVSILFLLCFMLL